MALLSLSGGAGDGHLEHELAGAADQARASLRLASRLERAWNEQDDTDDHENTEVSEYELLRASVGARLPDASASERHWVRP